MSEEEDCVDVEVEDAGNEREEMGGGKWERASPRWAR
jgi:hypothetical protein